MEVNSVKTDCSRESSQWVIVVIKLKRHVAVSGVLAQSSVVITSMLNMTNGQDISASS